MTFEEVVDTVSVAELQATVRELTEKVAAMDVLQRKYDALRSHCDCLEVENAALRNDAAGALIDILNEQFREKARNEQ